MPYLVDGDNLLGTWPARRRTDAERRRLAFQLERLGARLRRKTIVIFDGVEPPGARFGPHVRFAGPGSTADDLLLAFLREQPDRRGWTVVTSDRSLGDQCRYLGARVERSDLFRRQLMVDGNGEEEKPAREEDVDYWLREFGEQ